MISRGNQEGRLYPISIQNITNWIRFANVMIWCSVSPSCTTFGASPLFSASNYGTTSRTLRRRKPYHRSNCVFMTTIRKIIDNHSRWLETTSACKTQHTTTLSRDHNHNTPKTFLRYARWAPTSLSKNGTSRTLHRNTAITTTIHSGNGEE